MNSMQKSKWVKGVQKIVLMAVLACISLNNFAQNCVPAGNEVSYGTNNSWIKTSTSIRDISTGVV